MCVSPKRCLKDGRPQPYTAGAHRWRGGCTAPSNRLLAVYDNVRSSSPTHDFEGQPASGTLAYDYDQRGNLTSDQLKGISQISYCPLNMPTRLEWSTGQTLNFVYTATGRRLTNSHGSKNEGGEIPPPPLLLTGYLVGEADTLGLSLLQI